MKRFSILIVQIAALILLIVLPLTGLFYGYTSKVVKAAVDESAARAQMSLNYARTIMMEMNNSAHAEMTRISTSPDYIWGIATVKDYADIATNSDIVYDLNEVVSRLVSVQYADSRLKNVYLYTLDADYIITSDGGVLPTAGFDDWGWLDAYEAEVAAGASARTSLWSARVVESPDLIKNGYRDGRVSVFSYIYAFALSKAKTRSVLVMNYYEASISQVLLGGAQEDSVMLIDKDGVVVSHTNLDMIGRDLSGEAYVQAALAAPEGGCTLPYNSSDGRIVYAYAPLGLGGWTMIRACSMRALFAISGVIARDYLGAFCLALAIGVVLCILIYRRLFRPVAKLATELTPLSSAGRNEFLLISEAVDTMRREEMRLKSLLDERLDHTRFYYLTALLRGSKWDEPAPITLPHASCLAAIVKIDGAQDYVKSTSVEQRGYNRLLFARALEARSDARACLYCVDIDDVTIALVVSTSRGEAENALFLRECFEELKHNDARSFSVGIGALADDPNEIRVSFQQALEALKQRLTYGKGAIIFWHESLRGAAEYAYPLAIEIQLINGMLTQNDKVVKQALASLSKLLSGMPADNAYQAVNQLLSAIVSHLLKANMPLYGIEGGLQAWYTRINAQETLPELMLALEELIGEILDEIARAGENDGSYAAQIQQYLTEHYKSDVNFEDMAADIGISYSYMRRIARENLGVTLLDLLHKLRIADAKERLRNPAITVKDAALNVGYNNQQSFERFFRKFEGVSPTEWRQKLIQPHDI